MNPNNVPKHKHNNKNNDKSHNKEKNNQKPNNDVTHKKKFVLHYSDGYSNNLHSWLKRMSDTSGLFKEFKYTWATIFHSDPTKIELPELADDEPTQPPLLADGINYDAILLDKFKRSSMQFSERLTESHKVYKVIEENQSLESKNVCKLASSYDFVAKKRDPILLLKIILETHQYQLIQNKSAGKLSAMAKLSNFRMLENQSLAEYHEAFKNMIENQQPVFAASGFPLDDVDIAYAFIKGLSSYFDQYKTSITSNPLLLPPTLEKALVEVSNHRPIATVSQQPRSQTGFGTTGQPNQNQNQSQQGGKNQNNQAGGGSDNRRNQKDPTTPCPHCVKYHSNLPDDRKLHWEKHCPQKRDAITRAYGHAISESQPSTSSSQGAPQPATQSTEMLAASSNNIVSARSMAGGVAGRPSNQIWSNNISASGNVIVAELSKDASTYTNQNNTPHMEETILDAQSQVSIMNKYCSMITNIRRSSDTLTLHGMGKGSLYVDQIADHVVLGTVWYHPDASINVWQYRATELQCDVNPIKKLLPEYSVKVTTAFVAKSYMTGLEYRFQFWENLFILEGRHRYRC
jgi:hypothetical protein